MKISPRSNQISEMLNDSSASRSSVRQESSLPRPRERQQRDRNSTQSGIQMIGRVSARPKAPG